MEVDGYRDLFHTELTALSLPVLQTVRAAIREEIEKREAERKVAGIRLSNWENERGRKYFCLPNENKHSHNGSFRYLYDLLGEDWSPLFSGDEEKKYYTYVHYEPSNKIMRFVSDRCTIMLRGMPFYVGKGTGQRAFDLSRNQGHGEILRQLQKRGASAADVVAIVKDGLSEAQALELESKLIYFFGTRYEKGRRGLLVNLDIPPRPDGV